MITRLLKRFARVRPAERTRAYTSERWSGAKLTRVVATDAFAAVEAMYPAEKGHVFIRVEATGERLTVYRSSYGEAWQLR